MTARRDWLRRVARGGVAGGAAFALPRPRAGAAGPRADTGFDATLARLGAGAAEEDGRLRVEAPAEAWTGAFVGVRVDATALGLVRALHLLRDAHVPALLASLEPRGALPARLALPVRLERPCRLRALALTAKGWVRADAAVRAVGSPGCG